VSEAVRDRWIGATPSILRGAIARAAIQPMGLDVARFAAARAAAAPGAALEVAFVGRLVPIKGADVLVAAAAALRGPARVRIAGAGPEAARLDAAIAAARLPPGVVVERLGERLASARDALLGGADVVAIPSRAIGGRVEGAPRIALEAMAAGAAVVASASGGLAELPADAATLVAPDDPAALAAAIEGLARDPARRAAQVAAARARALGFGWDVVGARLERAARGAIDAG
jgi:glycosyltransferase involved in cell wall biosynthesis